MWESAEEFANGSQIWAKRSERIVVVLLSPLLIVQSLGLRYNRNAVKS